MGEAGAVVLQGKVIITAMVIFDKEDGRLDKLCRRFCDRVRLNENGLVNGRNESPAWVEDSYE